MSLRTNALATVVCAIVAMAVLAGSTSPARTLAWPTPVPPGVSWSADFRTGDFTQWSWWGQGQDELWGHIDVTTARAAGIPRLAPWLPRVARMTVTRRDFASGRYHAKLYRWFAVEGQGRTRPPDDVTGTYSAWYYIPRGYRVPRNGWANVFQFKETYGDRSDPLWWVQLAGAGWARDYGGRKRWTGPRPGRRGLVAFLNHWNRRSWNRTVRLATVPVGRWFEIRAHLRQGRRIDFRIDGRRFDTALAADHPVSPFHRDSRNWIFGVGNYAKAPGTTLYVGAASYRR